MSDVMDEEIRRGLAAEALAYEPPEDLAARTVAAAEAAGKPGLLGRIRGWAETPRLRRETGVPRLALAGMAMALLVGLYGVGYLSLESAGSRLSGGPQPDAPGVSDDPAGRPAAVPEPGVRQQQVEGQGPTAEYDPYSVDGGAGAQRGAGRGERSMGSQGGESAGAKTADDAAAVRPGGAPGAAISPPQPVPPGIRPPVPTNVAGPGVIRTAEMEVRVRKGAFGTAWSRAMSIAGKHGGFVAGSSADQVKGRLSRGTITVRVPAASLDAAIADFQRLGRLVRSTSSSSDVSGQLVDFDARIRAAQARELQLLELLRQARTVADSLQVSTALAEVRTEIESLQAQRANLQSQVDLAALTVSLYEPEAAPERPRPVDGRLATAWERAVEAGAITLSTILIGAGFLMPLAVLALIVWGGLRLRRRVALR